MTAAESEKALRYISQLDEARCNGQWQAVPELARKVEKHAPHRKCLTLAARSEAEVATFPSGPANPTARSALAALSSPLLVVIDEETLHPEDVLQATVCLGWIRWVLDEPGLASAALPQTFDYVIASLSRGEKVYEGWAKICLAKGLYIKGYSMEKTATWTEAVRTYSALLPYLSTVQSFAASAPPFQFFTERVLARLCLLSNQTSPSGAYVDVSDALVSFRLWARLFDYRPDAVSTASIGGDADKTHLKREVWKAYYETLSYILQRKMIYTTAEGSAKSEFHSSRDVLDEEAYLHARIRQRAELKRVERTYESMLLKGTQFPKASQTNEEVESWYELVMKNWRVFCGPTWDEEALGDETKAAVGYGVLDILYRAATKTFHSTQILRHLFITHASLADFDMAFKAFDSYVEIVTRGKDRAERSGETDEGMDDDNMIIRTAAEAIRVLCRFGTRKEAEKAKDISSTMEKWLHQQNPPPNSPNSPQAWSPGDAEVGAVTISTLSLRTLAVAYRVMGMSHAHWSRLTYDASSRSGLQARGVKYLRKALDPKLQDSQNLEALYSLGLLLAETRDLVGAIKLIKQALLPQSGPNSPRSPDGVMSDSQGQGEEGSFSRERQLVPLWHLLALLLTARGELVTATKFCEATFEQFLDPTNLFGPDDTTANFKSSHLNNALEKSTSENTHRKAPKGLVDRMEGFEKENILQVKMTQLSLVETLEGASTAVDGSDELLALYARLFGDPKAGEGDTKPYTGTTTAPKSSAGTFRGSIFGRSRSVKKFAEGRTTAAANPELSSIKTSIASRPGTTATSAPAIQVTHEDIPTVPTTPPQLFRSKSQHDNRSPSRRNESVKLRKKSISSIKRTSADVDGRPMSANSTTDGGRKDATIWTNGDAKHDLASTKASTTPPSVPPTVAERRTEESSELALRPIAHNLPNAAQPPPIGHVRQPPVQDVRLPAPFPRAEYSVMEPRFPAAQERRHKISLLVQIWLFISGLYDRAGSPEDAIAAVEEAIKLVGGFEREATKEKSSSRDFAERGWGGGKSVDELWADCWAERGNLALSQSAPDDAVTYFERALSHFPDHTAGIVGLSNILLDVYSEKSPAAHAVAQLTDATSDSTQERHHSSSPETLHRLAARDRAYSLLSSLTKLGAGWDCSEAWFALARAYEEGGQIEKAKEVLWWCVDLEDTAPLRSWRHVAAGGFVLL